MPNLNASTLSRTGLLIAGVLLSIPSFAAFLAPYTASYRVNLDNKLTGNASRELVALGNNRYRYTTSASAALLASARESSEFSVSNNQIIPENYLMQRKVFFRIRENRLTFDWNKNQLTTWHEGDTQTFELQPHTLDKLSVELQLRMELLAGQKAFEYPLADVDGILRYGYKLDGTETIDTPAGKIETIRLEKIHAADSKRQTTFWVAPKYQYLPAKVVQIDDDSRYELILTNLKYTGTKSGGKKK